MLVQITNDIECYECDKAAEDIRGHLTQWSKVAERFADVITWISYAGPDGKGGSGWNDLDTLELGNGDKDGLTFAGRQSMFTLWAISCAPLYLGSDLTKMNPADLSLITNKEIIAIDQAGLPARPRDSLVFNARRRVSKTSRPKAAAKPTPTSPAPASSPSAAHTHTVIHGLNFLLILHIVQNDYGGITSRRDKLPPFGL